MEAHLRHVLVMMLKGTQFPQETAVPPPPDERLGVPIDISLNGAEWANVKVKTTNDKARISLDGYTTREAAQNLPQYFSLSNGQHRTIYLQGVTVSEAKDDVEIEVYGEQLTEQCGKDMEVDQTLMPNGDSDPPYWTASFVLTDEEPFSVIDIKVVIAGDGEPVETDFVPLSDPYPVVTLKDFGIGEFHVGSDGSISVNVTGWVEDALADIVLEFGKLSGGTEIIVPLHRRIQWEFVSESSDDGSEGALAGALKSIPVLECVVRKTAQRPVFLDCLP